MLHGKCYCLRVLDDTIMQTLFLGILIIGGGVMLAQLGLRYVRHIVPVSFLQTNHQVAGFIFGILGAIYAVLLAFMIVILWNQYQDARAVVEREANQLTDLAQIAQSLPAPMRDQVKQRLRAYTQVAMDEEWPAMSEGQASPLAQSALDDLWKIYVVIEPQTSREQALYAQSLKNLEGLGESRRVRLYASQQDVPSLLWVFLVAGGVITVTFTYFFGVKSVRAQSLMTISLVSLIAFILFLIIILDNPFRRDLRISPEPLRRALERIQAS